MKVVVYCTSCYVQQIDATDDVCYCFASFMSLSKVHRYLVCCKGVQMSVVGSARVVINCLESSALCHVPPDFRSSVNLRKSHI